MATITASAAGGNWNTGTSWVGGVPPISSDDVLLAAGSGNITINAGQTVSCRSLDCTGFTGQLIWPNSSTRLNVGDGGGGNIKFVAGMTITLTGIGILGWLPTQASTTVTLTTAGKTIPNLTMGGGGTTTMQLADNMTSSGAMTLVSGIFDMNGKTVAATSFSSTGASTRVLTPGAAAVSLSSVAGWTVSGSNFSVSANTATTTLTAGASTFAGGGFNYNGMTMVQSGAGVASITGANTFGSLTRTGTAAIDCALSLAADQTITGTLTLTGNAAANRLWVLSSVPGTARTLTVNTTVTASRVDFEDITGAGAASWNLAGITDGSGDAGGNSGITLTTPATKFGVAAGNFSSTAVWALTSGGAAGAPYPLPQDNVVLNASSGAGTFTMNMQRHSKDITCTGFTGTLTLASSATQRYIFGSLILSAGMTLNASGNLTFAGRGSHTIDMAGKVFSTPTSRTITIGRFNGTYTLTSDANFGATSANTGTGVIFAGGVTFNAAGFNVTMTRVPNFLTATVNMGSGTWNLTGTAAENIWNLVFSLGTINPGTSNIVIANATSSNRVFAGGDATYYDLTYTVAGSTGALTITGSNTFHNLNFSDVTNARSLVFTQLTTQTFTGLFNVFGTPGKLITIGSNGGSNYILSKASGVVNTVDYVDLNRSTATGGAAWYAGSHSVDNGANSGWIFTAAPLTQGNFFLLF